MIKIFIDKKPLKVKEDLTILKAAEQAGIEIPHFCYHPAFPPEGSCRMCLVEIEGFPKLELACSTLVKERMKITTKSEKVVNARKAVLEFMLAEHPLDCPICDKAGDCKLQDYYEEYGFFENQFDESKEKRNKKTSLGKSLILDSERCILCSRCARFLREVTKTRELGIFNRGLHSEVGIYNDIIINNNYSGNLAEICPVGAITDKDFRFKTRSWFLKNGKSICPLCSRGCNILIEYHPGFPRIPTTKRIYRIKSLENQEVNGFWICDHGRYGYSYHDENRIEQIRMNPDEKKEGVTWKKALGRVSEKIKKLKNKKMTSHIALILHTGLSNEELFLFKRIFQNDLKIDKVYFIDNPEGEADSFLLTSERSPNKKGAHNIGFDFKPFNLKSLTEGTDILLMFGSYLSEHFALTEIKDTLDKIEAKFLFTSQSNEMNSFFDVVFPVALIAEKSGSLTNIEGKVQGFSPVLELPGESLPEWKVLMDLARKCGIDYSSYRQFISPEAIYKEMRKKIPFFRKKSE